MTVSSFDPRFLDWTEAVELHAWLEVQRQIAIPLPQPQNHTVRSDRETVCALCSRPMIGRRAGSMCAACKNEREIERKRAWRRRKAAA